MTPPGSLRHLVRRFFGSLGGRRPSPADQLWVASVLAPAEAGLFWAQPAIDQRHGVDVARAVTRSTTDPLVIRAALLHDVGKRHSYTGVAGRSVTSVLALLRIPVRGRWRTYLDHGEIGAADLADAGSDGLVVAFARHHHTAAPPDFPADSWTALSSADGG